MDRNLLRFAHGTMGGVKTLNGGPGGAAGKRVVHLGGVLEVAETGLLQVFLRRSVPASRFARDQPLGFQGWNAQVKDEALAREAVNGVLEMLDPFQECGTLRGRDASGLVGEIGGHV